MALVNGPDCGRLRRRLTNKRLQGCSMLELGRFPARSARMWIFRSQTEYEELCALHPHVLLEALLDGPLDGLSDVPPEAPSPVPLPVPSVGLRAAAAPVLLRTMLEPSKTGSYQSHISAPLTSRMECTPIIAKAAQASESGRSLRHRPERDASDGPIVTQLLGRSSS